jgi:hypothetical protein
VKKEFAMKRISLRILLMILTFGLGLGSHWAFTKLKSRELKPVAQVATDPPKTAQTRFEPVFYPVTVPAQPNVTFDYDTTKFFPEGSYELTGDTAREFRDFSGFALWRGDAADSLKIDVFTHSNDVWNNEPAAFGWIKERRLFFISQPWSPTANRANSPNVVYRFEGEFLRNDPGSAAENTPVLRGKLTKMKDGRTIAERVVTFQLSIDHC